MTEAIAADDVAGATAVAPDQPMDGVTAQQQQAANGTAHAEGAADATQPAAEPAQPEDPVLTKLQETWAALQQDPDADFSTWTSLVSTAEKLGDPQQLRKAYDAFLARYPLCYGYWKKYAEAEKRHGISSTAAAAAADPAATAAGVAAAAAGSSSSGGVDAAAAVYQRGVAAVPHSAELWVAYAALLQGSDAPSEDVRSVYEAGAAAVGSDYTSGLLWDKYLAYEATQGVPSAVAALYARVLACPVKDLDKYHTGLTNYASSRTAAELLPEDTIAALRAQLEGAAAEAATAAAAEAAAKAVAAAEAAASEEQQGEDAEMQAEEGSAAAAEGAAADADTAAAAGGEAGGSQADVEMAEAQPAAAAADAAAEAPADATAANSQPSAAADPTAADPAAAEPAVIDDAAIKAAWLAEQQSVYEDTKQHLAAVAGFEGAIRRPYWHHKPLDGQQLQAWASYLDWQQRQGDAAATQRLLERCLVPCANYPEFWIRYVLWCQAQAAASTDGANGSADDGGISIPDVHASAVLARAVGTFCSRHPGLGIFAARFFEARGDAGAARAQYQHLVDNVAPGLIEAVVAYANFEHRASGPAAAKAVFEQALASSKQQQQQQQQAKKKGAAGDAAAEGGSSSSSSGFLYVVYANFLRQVCDDVAAARAVLQSGLAAHPGCKELWDAALWFEETLPGADRVERVLALYEQLLEPKAATVAKQQQQQDGSNDVEPAAAAAGADAAGGSTAAAADGAAAPKLQEDAGKGSDSATAAAAAADGALPDDVLEQLSLRCVEFADTYADLQTLQGVYERHVQLFPLPAAAIAAKRQQGASAAGGSAAAAAATAADGYAAAARPDAGAAADHAGYAAAGYYPPPPVGGYYPPPQHYPQHGAYPPPHHYGPPPGHYGHHYGSYGGYGGY